MKEVYMSSLLILFLDRLNMVSYLIHMIRQMNLIVLLMNAIYQKALLLSLPVEMSVLITYPIKQNNGLQTWVQRKYGTSNSEKVLHSSELLDEFKHKKNVQQINNRQFTLPKFLVFLNIIQKAVTINKKVRQKDLQKMHKFNSPQPIHINISVNQN